MKSDGTEKVANGEMAKLGGTDTQTLKFLFCVPRHPKVGHPNSVAPIWIQLH